jgi:hypothetical protein
LHNQIRYQLDIMDSPERLVKSLKTLSSDRLLVKINENDPARVPFRISRREAKLELVIEGEILLGKANTSILNFSGHYAMPPAKMRLQRGLVGTLALIAAAFALQLGFWLLPAPLGIVDTTLFVSGVVVLLMGIGTVAWLADFFLVRRAISRERYAVQREMRQLVEAVFLLVQPVIRPDYGNLDDTETLPADMIDNS